MALIPVSAERHAKTYLQATKNYKFVAEESVLPLVLPELPQAAVAMPIAFVKEGDGYIPVAMLSPERAKNLFVGEDGSWLGRHIPTVLKAYPFRLGKDESQQRLMLCVEENSACLTSSAEGMPLFTPDAKPSHLLQKAMDLLVQLEKDIQATRQAISQLEHHRLIHPWPIEINTPNGHHPVPGYFCINEAALNKLSDDAFVALRKSGALFLATCQLISMQNLNLLGDLSLKHAVPN